MAIEAITFEEDGYQRELTTLREYREAIAGGRLAPETPVKCYDALGVFTRALAGEVALLQPIFLDPREPPDVAVPRSLPPAPALVEEVIAPVQAPPSPAEPASGVPRMVTAEPAPMRPAPVLNADSRPPVPSGPGRPAPRPRHGCGWAFLATVVLVFAAIAAVFLMRGGGGQDNPATAASRYSEVGGAATFYVTRPTNVRPEPGTNRDRVAQLFRNTSFTGQRVRTPGNDDYVRIDSGAQRGNFVWGFNVAADALPPLDSAEAGSHRLVAAADIVARPDAAAAIVEHRDAGASVLLSGTVGDGQWGEVLLSHGIGYVAAAAYTPAPAPLPQPTDDGPIQPGSDDE